MWTGKQLRALAAVARRGKPTERYTQGLLYQSFDGFERLVAFNRWACVYVDRPNDAVSADAPDIIIDTDTFRECRAGDLAVIDRHERCLRVQSARNGSRARVVPFAELEGRFPAYEYVVPKRIDAVSAANREASENHAHIIPFDPILLSDLLKVAEAVRAGSTDWQNPCWIQAGRPGKERDERGISMGACRIECSSSEDGVSMVGVIMPTKTILSQVCDPDTRDRLNAIDERSETGAA